MNTAEQPADESSSRKKSRQSRGGKGSGPKKPSEQKVSVSRATRGKNKFTTSVIGLDTYGLGTIFMCFMLACWLYLALFVQQFLALFSCYLYSSLSVPRPGIDLKQAAKFFGQRFATGSSANNSGEIVIQGDVKFELMELIPQKWKEVSQTASSKT